MDIKAVKNIETDCLAARSPKQPVRTIVCLGDSITYGHGVASNRQQDAWPFVLQRLLNNCLANGADPTDTVSGCNIADPADCRSAFKVLNFGINGATALKNTPESYEASGLLDKALASGADTFILMLGSNDTKERYWDPQQYEEDLESIVCRILGTVPAHEGVRSTEQSKPQLFLMLPPAAFEDENGETAYGVSDEAIRLGVIPAIKRTAQKHSLPVIDLYSITAGHPELYLEGVHPNRAGNLAIAERIFSEL